MHWPIDGEYTLVRFLLVCRSKNGMDIEGNGEEEGISVYGYTSCLVFQLKSRVRVTARSVVRGQ